MISERSLFLHLLRILSATVVCVGHAKEFFLVHRSGNDSIFEDLLRALMSLGGASVLVFFFLSGYLVGGNEINRAQKGMLRPRKYLLDRFTRLWLVLIPALFFTMGLNLLTCAPNNQSLYCSADTALASHAYVPPLQSQSLSDLLGNLFFLQPFQLNVFGGNGPLWSLSYEFWYYIIFYSILLVVFRNKNKFISKESGIIFLIACIGLSVVSLHWIGLSLIWTSGALASRIIWHIDSRLRVPGSSYFASRKMPKLLIILILPALVCPSVFPRVIAYPMLVILLGFSIALTHDHKKILKTSKFNRLIVLGSEMSFSLYLIHFPILAFLASKFTPIARWNLNLESMFFIFLSTFICLIISFVFAFFTEFKLHYVRSRMFNFYSIEK